MPRPTQQVPKPAGWREVQRRAEGDAEGRAHRELWAPAHLVDELAAELVVVDQHRQPEVGVGALHNVARLGEGGVCLCGRELGGARAPHQRVTGEDSRCTLLALKQPQNQPHLSMRPAFADSGPLPCRPLAHLQLEHGVLVGALHQRLVALPPLVRHAGQAGVALLGKLAHHLGGGKGEHARET